MIKINKLAAGSIIFLFIFSLLISVAEATVTPSSRRTKGVKGRWKYILIHHSATNNGNAKRFDSYHRRRGMKNGMAYHFVINNGSAGTFDGKLEIGSRWKKQINGGHCRQRWVNNTGIGICLVGNFNKKEVSEKQFSVLYKLCRILMDKYDIPVRNVIGHGEMKGEHSECPGKYFPMRELREALKRPSNVSYSAVP